MKSNRFTDRFIRTNLVTNGEFATDLSGWSPVIGASTISIVNSISGNGTVGFLRFTTVADDNYDRFSQLLPINSNTSYIISFYYKTTSITGNFSFFFNANPATLSNIIQKSISPSETWTYKEIYLDTTSTNGFPYLSIAKNGNIGAGYIDIDGIVMYKLNF